MRNSTSILNVAGILLIVVFVCLVIFPGCTKKESSRPAETTLDTLLFPPESIVTIPVRYKLSEVEKMINTKIKGTVMKKWMVIDDKGDSLFLEISKTSDIKLSRQGKTLYFTIPLHISGKFIARIAKIKIKNSTPVEADVVIKLASKLHLDPKWNLITDTQVEEIKWVKEPDIKIGLIKINLGKALMKMLENKEESLLVKADEAITHLIDSRKIVNKLWLDLQKPIRINKKDVNVYLKVHGNDLAGLLEDTDPELLSMKFELSGHVRTLISGDSIPVSNPVLPDFKHSPKGNDSIVLFIHSILKYSQINKMLNKQLAGQKLESSGLSTTIQKLRIYGTPEGVAVEINVKGNVDGTLYVQGQPYFDTTKYEVGLRNFDFALDSENPVLSSADWLVHTKVLDMVSDKLVYNVSPLADKLPELIHQGIEKGKSGEKIDININRLAITPMEILTTKNDVQLIVRGVGIAEVQLEKEVFGRKKNTPVVTTLDSATVL